MEKSRKGKGKSSKFKNNSKGRNQKFNRGKTYRNDEAYGQDASNSEERRGYGGGSNDVSWYTKNPALLVAAGQFPYPYRPGMDLQVGNLVGYDPKTGAQSNYTWGKFTMPGIITIHWVPTFGRSATATDPGSIAGKEIYAKVRAAFSGSLDADAPDFMTYLLCLDSVFSYIAWLKRIYRVLTIWTPDNYLLPDTLLKAMDIPAKAIPIFRANMTQFWQLINELVLMSRKFTCPALMDVMNRHYWMSDNVYADDATLNSQMYVFNPEGFYIYNELDDPNNTGIKVPGASIAPLFTNLFSEPSDGSNPISVERLYNFGRSMIDAMVAWDDAYTINGYLARAYQGVPQFVVDELEQRPTFTPVYNPEVLAQIENVQTLPMCFSNLVYASQTGSSDVEWMNVLQDPKTNAFLSLSDFTVRFDNGATGADISLNDTRSELISGSMLLNPYISSRSVAPQVADNVVASRLKTCMKLTPTSDPKVFTCHVICGTEIVTKLTYNGATTFAMSTDIPEDYFFGSATGITTIRRNLWNISTADWHPLFRMVRVNSGEQGIRFMGDIHNLTVISQDDLENLHKVCIYSELNAFMV